MSIQRLSYIKVHFILFWVDKKSMCVWWLAVHIQHVQRSFQFTNFLLFKRSLVDNIPEEGNKLNGKLIFYKLPQTRDWLFNYLKSWVCISFICHDFFLDFLFMNPISHFRVNHVKVKFIRILVKSLFAQFLEGTLLLIVIFCSDSVIFFLFE